ncbi:MAG TPA: hypothetical protein VGG07_05175 [Solirubrobacteraceae bacterium]
MRSTRHRSLVAATAGACAAMACLIAVPAASAAPDAGWTVQPTPPLPSDIQLPPDVPPATGEGSFAGVSCASADACTAVGQESPGDVPAGELAEVWDGTAWSVIETDTLDFDFGSKLVSVSCGAPGACIAVGSGQSPNTTAVSQVLTETSAEGAGAPADFDIAELLSVSCASISECMAVGNTGDFNQPLIIDHLADGAWTSLNPPLPADSHPSLLSEVSCAAASFCMALGFDADGNTFIETWDGTSWALTPPPNPPGATSSSLGVVSCPAVGDCVALGSWGNQSGSHLLAEQFRHGAWEQISAPPLAADGSEPAIAAIACPARNVCTVVGSATDPDPNTGGPTHPYAARLHHGRWELQAPLDVPGAADDSFASVSCPTRRACTAVGQSVGNGTSDVGSLQPLVEHWVRSGHHHGRRHGDRGRSGRSRERGRTGRRGR